MLLQMLLPPPAPLPLVLAQLPGLIVLLGWMEHWGLQAYQMSEMVCQQVD